jgi:hypothetical protein
MASELILPGFAPVVVSGTTVELGNDRKYRWADSYLPIRVDAVTEPLAGPMELLVVTGGREIRLTPLHVTAEESSSTATTIRAHGSIAHATIEVATRIEYDGLAMSRMTIKADQPITIAYIDFIVPITGTPTTQLMHWDIPTYRKHIRSLPAGPPQYDGLFQHIVALADGTRSFWWFTDDAGPWISNPKNTTRIEPKGHYIVLTQRLMIGEVAPSEPVEIRFNFLATPVRDTSNMRERSHRVASRVTHEEGRSAGLHLWWPEAFPHQALPYTEYPPGVAQDMPPADSRLFLGRGGINSALETARHVGITRLPYFSAHAPSLYDPAVRLHRRQWEVVPPFVIRPGADAPFTSTLERPWLSLRGPGLIEHLLERFAKVIDEVKIEGLYFDQGAPINSENPEHGAWRSPNGHAYGTLDVLAMRRYFKSLAELFYRKGKEGYLVVHMSSVPIIPAYTFVTALVQGEEFLLELKNVDYINSVSPDIVRTQYVPDQYGIGSIWLDQLWSPRVPGKPAARYANQEQWLNSTEHYSAWRNYMSLVVLHDATPWTFAPIRNREEVYRVFDQFDTTHAKFTGYWKHPLSINESDDCVASLYQSTREGKALIIAANLGSHDNSISINRVCSVIPGACPNALRFRINGMDSWTSVTNDHIKIPVSARDFVLIEVGPVRASNVEKSAIMSPSNGRLK